MSFDDKARYSRGAKEQIALGAEEKIQAKRLERGRARRSEHGAKWQSVNLNELIRRFAPDASPEPRQKGIKITWHSPTTGLDIVADVTGYVRIQDRRNPRKQKVFLDLSGKCVDDYLPMPGETQTELNDRKMRNSHFRILKREEM